MIQVVPETGSTNTDLAAHVRAGQPPAEGAWLVADRQTAGRGRQGRDWIDGAGNFMGSTLVRRSPSDPPAQTLAFVAALAAFDALAPYCDGGGLRLKWPNDVLLDGGKLAGILLEGVGDAVVIGIGANLAQAPVIPERPAVVLPRPIVRDTFAEELAARFADELARWRTYGVGQLLKRWSELAHPAGEPLTVHEPGGKAISGTYAGLGPDGALLLRLADGATRAIHAGDVMLEGR